MTFYLQLVSEPPVRLWGLTSRERIARVLANDDPQWIDAQSDLPPSAEVLLLRGDFLYDNRVLRSLVDGDRIALRAGDDSIVAVRVPAPLVPRALAVLDGSSPIHTIPEVAVETARSLVSGYNPQLLKIEPPFVVRIREQDRAQLEQRLFSGAYKGITDFVTKWAWPRPASAVTRLCTRIGAQPNHVTWLSVVLVALAGWWFTNGDYSYGLLAGWLMTFLDTVDGKLARVTITSSRLGHALDKGLDLIHPPLWYIAWGLGLGSYDVGVSLDATFWIIVGGYLIGRLVEGGFHLWLGSFGIFCWRPVDSYSRLVTARRNPNLVLLSMGFLAGRPDWGLFAVALWTLLSSVVLSLQLAAGVHARITKGPLRSWLLDVDIAAENPTLAARWFVGIQRD